MVFWKVLWVFASLTAAHCLIFICLWPLQQSGGSSLHQRHSQAQPLLAVSTAATSMRRHSIKNGSRQATAAKQLCCILSSSRTGCGRSRMQEEMAMRTLPVCSFRRLASELLERVQKPVCRVLHYCSAGILEQVQARYALWVGSISRSTSVEAALCSETCPSQAQIDHRSLAQCRLSIQQSACWLGPRQHQN